MKSNGILGLSNLKSHKNFIELAQENGQLEVYFLGIL